MDGQFAVKKFTESGAEIVEKERVSLHAKRERQILAPVLFEDSTDSVWFNDWFEKHLFKELRQKSTIIMENASDKASSTKRRISVK
jgi:hypothetical protein